MFSPQVSAGNPDGLNPARRRTKQTTSRPASRTASRQDRHTRSGSDASNARTDRDRHVGASRRDSNSSAGGDVSVVRRASAAPGVKDTDRDGGVVEWTKNENYRVAKLPALPAIFKSNSANDKAVTAIADSYHGYALLLSHTSAYIWKYTDTHSIPNPYNFPLPRDEGSDSSIPFPLGSLVRPSANSNEPGLVVVMPMTGRIAYWDAMGRSVSEGLFKNKRGVEGRVPILSGESVTAITAAEPAGFILTTSNGRLAHVALQDNTGAPSVNVTIMKSQSSSFVGGFLNTFKAGGIRKEIVAVRAGKQLRMGEREVVVATKNGTFSRWQVTRSSQGATITDVDLKDAIIDEVERVAGRELEGRSREQFAVLDFDIQEYQGDDALLLILGAFLPPWGAKQKALYALIPIRLPQNGTPDILPPHIIQSYKTPITESGMLARLYFPKPHKTAFVVFRQGVVVVSMQRPSGPDSMATDYGSFEDVVDFREGEAEIVGSGAEDAEDNKAEATGSFSTQDHVKRPRNPGVIVLAKGAGVLRIEAFDNARHKTQAAPAPVTIKSKLEQAVFYAKEDNPLNFLGREEVVFPIQDVEDAALELSSEIMNSRSNFMLKLLPSMGEHLKLRGVYLRGLVAKLETGRFGTVSRKILWKLLADAEKVEAARAIWEVRDRRLHENPPAPDEDGLPAGLLEQCIEKSLVPEYNVIGNNPENTWFYHHVDKMDKLLIAAKVLLRTQKAKGNRNILSFAGFDAEANDIVAAGLIAAWNFRVKSASQYRLSGKGGIDSNGCLQHSGGYDAPWTSDEDILQALDDQFDLSSTTHRTLGKQTADPDRLSLTARIEDQLVELAEICCRAFEERAHWCAAQKTDEFDKAAHDVRVRYEGARGGWIKPLVNIDRLDDAYRVAEKWHDYRTLVEICAEQLLEAEAGLHDGKEKDPAKVANLKAAKTQINDRLAGYFTRFGRAFAETYYDFLVETGRLNHLLVGFEQWHKQFLTDFLHGNEDYAKVAWIHDVAALDDYDRAGKELLKIATYQEADLRKQRIELSIGKLAALAGAANRDEATTLDTSAYDLKLQLIAIQRQVYHTILLTAHNALDHDAAAQLLLEEYGGRLSKKSALYELLKRDFTKLVSQKCLDPEDMVDLLTLARRTDISEAGILDGEDGGSEFFLSLKVIGIAGLRESARLRAERTIWRRCFLMDDWIALTSTTRQTDAAVQARAHETALYRTLKLCYENKLFSHNSPFRPVDPKDSLFPENPEDVKARFAGAEDEQFIMSVAQDLMNENSALKRVLAKTNFKEWWRGLVEQAKREVEEEQQEQEETVTLEGEEMEMEEGDTMMTMEERSEEGSYVEEDTFAGHNGRDFDGDETME